MITRFILALHILTIPAALAETEIALEDAPPKVIETAIATAPGVDLFRVTVEEEDGRRIFEFEARGATGEHIEIDVFEDGSLDEIEMEIPEEELPKAVRDALARVEPGFAVDYVETSIRQDGVFVYEIEGRTNGGKKLAIEIREDGSILRREGAAQS